MMVAVAPEAGAVAHVAFDLDTQRLAGEGSLGVEQVETVCDYLQFLAVGLGVSGKLVVVVVVGVAHSLSMTLNGGTGWFRNTAKVDARSSNTPSSAYSYLKRPSASTWNLYGSPFPPTVASL